MSKLFITLFLAVLVNVSFSVQANIVTDNSLSEEHCHVLEKGEPLYLKSIIFGQNTLVNHSVDEYSNDTLIQNYSDITPIDTCNMVSCEIGSNYCSACFNLGMFAGISPDFIRYDFNSFSQKLDILSATSYASILIAPRLRPPII